MDNKCIMPAVPRKKIYYVLIKQVKAVPELWTGFG
jgi:hypothetical protein